MEEWREDPGGGGYVSSSGDKPARHLLAYFRDDYGGDCQALTSKIERHTSTSIMVSGELVEYVGEGATWASQVRSHPVVALTDMFEDASAEAA
jgi:hypothetical protein